MTRGAVDSPAGQLHHATHSRTRAHGRGRAGARLRACRFRRTERTFRRATSRRRFRTCARALCWISAAVRATSCCVSRRDIPALVVHGLDGSAAMLHFASERLHESPALGGRVQFIEGVLPGATLPLAAYDAVISNSLLHHLHDPRCSGGRCRRPAGPGLPCWSWTCSGPASRPRPRPSSSSTRRASPRCCKRDFLASLCAAFEPDEIRAATRRVRPRRARRPDGVRPARAGRRGDLPADERFHRLRAAGPAARALARHALGASSVLPDDVRDRSPATRHVVYALEKRSVIDLAVLEYVCRERGLPRPALAPLGAAGACCRRRCCSSNDAPASSAQRIDRRMPEALRALSTAAAEDIDVRGGHRARQPVLGTAPDRERSWFRLLVAEGWDIGGRFRKLLSLADQRTQPARAVRRAAAAATGARGNARHDARPASAVAPAAHAVPQPARRDDRSRPVAPAHDRRRGAAHAGRARRGAPRTCSEKRARAARSAAGRARLRLRDRGQLFALVRRVHVGRARPALEPALRRRRTRQLLEPAVASTKAARSSTCRATAATWTTCCCRTSCITRATPSRTSRPAST